MSLTSVLRQTDNLIAIYQYAIGSSRVPVQLHQWCALSGIAACVEDHVYVEKLGKPLSPQLWVFLIAPPASGKGTAIKELMSYMISAEVNYIYGEVTAQALLKRTAGKPKEGGRERSKVFLVNEEAANCIHNGPQARDFITQMTALYELPRGVLYHKDAVTSGAFTTHDLTINWLLGSNMKWAVDSIPREAIELGFLGRILPIVIDERDIDRDDKTIALRPDDFDECRKVLAERFGELRTVGGEFGVSKLARAFHRDWELERKMPKDDRLAATYTRMDDNVWKLAMVFSLADSIELLIKERHIRQAINATEGLIPSAVKMMNAASVTERTRSAWDVERILKDHAGWLKHTALLQRCHRNGLDAFGMKVGLDSLEGRGKLEKRRYENATKRGGICYRFISRHGR